jgi:Icc-related predicted phosphoesterase
MRLVVFTDIHGNLSRVQEILMAEHPCDALIVGGDLTTMGTPEEAERALRALGHPARPVLAVAGNMDPPAIDEAFRRLGVSLDGCGIIMGGVGLFGVSAAPVSPLRTPNEISEAEITRRAERGWNDVATARWKIFVPHAPPKDTSLDRLPGGRHVGSTAVRTFIERFQPDLVLCGHIHEARGTERLGKTLMVNCGPAGKGSYAVVTVSDTVEAVLSP